MPADISILLEDSLQPTNYSYAVSHVVLETGFQILHETGRITDEFDSIIMEDNSTILLEKGSLTGGNALLYEGNQFVANEALVVELCQRVQKQVEKTMRLH